MCEYSLASLAITFIDLKSLQYIMWFQMLSKIRQFFTNQDKTNGIYILFYYYNSMFYTLQIIYCSE